MKWRYRIPLWLLVVVVVLVGARLALPWIVRDVVNARMAEMGDYRGHVADVDLHVWRGAYSLEDLTIDKVGDEVPVPLLAAPRTDIALSWRALRHGTIRARVDFIDPLLNFVDGSGSADSQAGRGVNWRDQLQDIIPIRLDEVNVRNGKVTFHNFVSEPKVDLEATAVEATVLNLTNADRAEGRRVATIEATANILGDAPLETRASFDPLERIGDFDFELRVLRIDLTKANDLARAYAGLDFHSGHGDFVMELAARDGQLEGYAKPLLKDMQIFSWEQDVERGDKNPLRIAWEALSEAVTSIFTNQEQQQFATRVPISGRIDDRDLGTWRAIINVLRNAFVEAYTPQLEHLRPAPEEADAG